MIYRALRWLTALAALLAGPSIAATSENVFRLAPVTPWHVDWTKTSCTLARGFGEKDNQHVLRFEQFAPRQDFQMVIASAALRGLRETDKPSIVYANEDGAQFEQKIARAVIGSSPKSEPTLFIPDSALYSDDMGGGRTRDVKITQIGVTFRGRSIVLNTGSLDEPIAAMRSCMDDLVKSWGLDPAQLRHLTKLPQPKSSPGSWLKSSDYPKSSLRKGAQALVAFRLLIDSSGTPTDCLVQRSYSDAIFDKTVCSKMLERARFEPALDGQGQPTPSYFADEVVWLIGK